MIHIVNGDVVGNKIQQIDGDIIVWREMYDFGPLSLTWSKEEQINRRAHFFEEKLGIPSKVFIDNCQRQNSLLNDIPKSEEIILWFEHDRFDQTMLMYLLTELSSKGFRNLSMISINQYPGIDPFHGLGQLSSEQLIELLEIKKEITNEQIHEAVTGWKAYNSNDRDDIEKWILTENHFLPFLLQVFKDHRGYFPSHKTGLNEVESLALSFIKEGECLFYNLFNSIAKNRLNDGLSNLHFAAILNELMKGSHPLLFSDIPLPNYLLPASNAKLELTSHGLDVLNGEQNRIHLVGIDWWVGGVHLRHGSIK
ncbi:DUF1835 domain-containing protein [Neobacillus sp. PS3-34]|uniref:DUF1835 domain-containing protein n=1 Tax=Neobacillus sp. PS3-34 TaxID=3070678 RepID=UPI0027E01FF2|nr:DUF1835 domain-containing protein [Neobacillus sp. PS3-34]WML46711.1 DUF1835 domain-containing protein [Neobacillus sp. PS3-34]